MADIDQESVDLVDALLGSGNSDKAVDPDKMLGEGQADFFIPLRRKISEGISKSKMYAAGNNAHGLGTELLWDENHMGNAEYHAGYTDAVLFHTLREQERKKKASAATAEDDNVEEEDEGVDSLTPADMRNMKKRHAEFVEYMKNKPSANTELSRLREKLGKRPDGLVGIKRPEKRDAPKTYRIVNADRIPVDIDEDIDWDDPSVEPNQVLYDTYVRKPTEKERQEQKHSVMLDKEEDEDEGFYKKMGWIPEDEEHEKLLKELDDETLGRKKYEEIDPEPTGTTLKGKNYVIHIAKVINLHVHNR